MLVAVVIAFFVCWAPFHTQRLLVVYVNPSQWTRKLRTLNEVLYYTAGCLYYFSATINPILYSLMSVKYREAFRDALCTLSKSKQRLSTADFDQGATVVVVGASPQLVDDPEVARLDPYPFLQQRPQEVPLLVGGVEKNSSMKTLLIQTMLGVRPNMAKATCASSVTREADDVLSYAEQDQERTRDGSKGYDNIQARHEGETVV